MIGQLSQLLRLSLRTSHAHEVPLRDELEVLECYLGLMRARFGSRLRANVDVEPDVLDALVPSLVLQPLVENAIRYGNAAQAVGGTIDARAWRVGETLHLDVADDGPGAALGADIFGGGVGLSATRDRLHLLYADAHRFEVGNRERGFGVRIEIPYRVARTGTTEPIDQLAAATDDAPPPAVATAR